MIRLGQSGDLCLYSIQFCTELCNNIVSSHVHDLITQFVGFGCAELLVLLLPQQFEKSVRVRCWFKHEKLNKVC